MADTIKVRLIKGHRYVLPNGTKMARGLTYAMPASQRSYFENKRDIFEILGSRAPSEARVVTSRRRRPAPEKLGGPEPVTREELAAEAPEAPEADEPAVATTSEERDAMWAELPEAGVLMRMRRDDLRELATSLMVPWNDEDTKASIVEALEAGRPS